MLTALEYHIEVGQGFQKAASNVYDYFQPEEIDYCLNKHVDRFIERCVRPRKDGSGAFEINEASLADIQNIIKKDHTLTVYKAGEDKGYALMPRDYNYLLNDRSIMVSDCTTNFTTDVTGKSEYIGLLRFTDSVKGSAPYYNTLSITINGNTVFDIVNYKISTGLNAVNEKFVIIHLILEVLTSRGINVYWERYRDLYEQDKFIIVSDIALTGSINIDGTVNVMTVSSTSYDIFMSGSEKEVTNRLTNSAALPSVLNDNVLYKSISRSPVSNLAGNKLFIFHSKRFIVNTAVIDYVRKPRKISLLLNQSCDLSENAARKICDLTVEYLKNIVESPAYQLKVQDNLLRME